MMRKSPDAVNNYARKYNRLANFFPNQRTNGHGRALPYDGGRAHLDGQEESDIPHPANSEEGQEWLRGYRWSVEACGDGERELAAV